MKLIKVMTACDDFDQYCLSQARANLTQGFMWLNRAVFRPYNIFDDISADVLDDIDHSKVAA